MLFDEAHTVALKQLVVKLLEPISDADSDVLGDYVLALLRHDQTPDKVRELCISQLVDFLGSNTNRFVDEVFAALDSEAYRKQNLIYPVTSQGIERKESAEISDNGANSQSNSQVEYSISSGKHKDRHLGSRTTSMRSNHGRGEFDGHGKRRPRIINKPCYEFQKRGYCSRGSRCQYRHQTSSDSDSVPIPPPELMFPPELFMKQFMDPQFIASITGQKNHKPFQHDIIHGPMYDKSCTTLIVDKIPPELIEESKIDEYFATFGPIESIELLPNRSRVRLKYNDWESADRAWKSPEPIFNNRFIKVFWEKPSKKKESEEHIDPEKLKALLEEKQKIHEEKMLRKEAYQMAQNELAQKKRDLFAKQIEEQKRIMQKFEVHKQRNAGNGNFDNHEVLQRQLDALKAEAHALGINDEEVLHGTGHIREGHRRGRGAARIARSQSRPLKLDFRPKALIIDQIEPDAEEVLKQIILQTGPFERYETSGSSILVEMKERWLAEKVLASLHARKPELKDAKIRWAANEQKKQDDDSQDMEL